MARWPFTALAVGALLFASALEIHLHRGGGGVPSSAGTTPGVDVTPAERAALDAPADVTKWVDLAEAYAAAGRMDEAARAFGQARGLDANHPRVAAAPNWIGSAAILDVEREVLLDPANDEAWGRAADVIAGSGDTARAIDYYLRALRLDPSDSEWPGKLIALGPDPRIDRFVAQWAATAGDGDDEALGDIADGLKTSGRWREACTFYARALEADPSDSEWTSAIDECARRFPSDFQPAAQYAMEAFARRVEGSRDDELIGDYADMLRERGRIDEACEQYARAAELDPSDSEWTRAMISCPGTGLDLDTMRATAAGDDEALGDMADVLREIGRETDACEFYREALRLDPSDDEWQSAVRGCR